MAASVVGALDGIHALAEDLIDELRTGRVDAVGDVLAEHWQLKTRLSSAGTNTRVHRLHDAASNAGATGGKLLGAGGRGFLLFAVPAGTPMGTEQCGSRVVTLPGSKIKSTVVGWDAGSSVWPLAPSNCSRMCE